jgi:hypothetical protein
MILYKEQLKFFHNAVIHGKSGPMLPHIHQPDGSLTPVERRLSIYSMGYSKRLVEAVEGDYTALAHYLGKERCKDLITDFVHNTTSTYWDLNQYTGKFASYCKKHFANEPHLLALATLEGAISEVFWAEDIPPLSPLMLSSMDANTLGEFKFALSPAVRILELPAKAHRYLTYFRKDTPLPNMQKGREYILVVRYQNRVKRYRLSRAEFLFLLALNETRSFNEVLASIEHIPSLIKHLSVYLQRCFKRGVFIS